MSERGIARELHISRATVGRTRQRLELLSAIGATDEFAAPAPVGMQYSRLSRMMRDGDGNIQWLIATKKDADKLEAMRAIAEGIVGDKRATVPEPRVELAADWCNVITIADAHIGMAAWQENGNAWSIDDAVSRITRGVDDLLAGIRPAEHAWLINPGDFLHANDSSRSTPKSGHLLDHDGPFERAVKAAGYLMADIIDKLLATHRHVTVCNVPGNHDPDAPAWLDMVLGMYYGERVTIQARAHKTAHMQFGRNYLAVNHGDRMKPRALADAMARHPLWGQSVNRYGITGHRHKYEVEPAPNGATIYTMAPPIPQDEYAGDGGWPVSQKLHHWSLHRDHGIRHTQLLDLSY